MKEICQTCSVQSLRDFQKVRAQSSRSVGCSVYGANLWHFVMSDKEIGFCVLLVIISPLQPPEMEKSSSSCSQAAPTCTAMLQVNGTATSGIHIVLSLSCPGWLPVLHSLSAAVSAGKVLEYSWEGLCQQSRAGVNLQWRGDDRQWGRPRAVTFAVSTAGMAEQHVAKYLIFGKAPHIIPTVLLFIITRTKYVNLCHEKLFCAGDKTHAIAAQFCNIHPFCVGYKNDFAVGILAI